MRDLFFLLALPFIVFATVKRPFIGLGIWIWTAMFFPNAWVYGPAAVLRYNLLFAVIAIATYILSKEKQPLRLGSLGVLVLLFFSWSTVSTFLTSADPDSAWESWNRFSKVILLFIFVLLIINKKLHIDFFLWCLVLSIGFYGGLEGLKFVISGGGHKIAGFDGHILGDRNELALAFVMMLPICYYLINEYGKKSAVLRLGLIGLMVILVGAIIGTHSRGGGVALLSIGGYLFLKSKHKLAFGFAVAIVAFGMAGLVSEEWTSRMTSIETADQDESFLARLVSWKLSFILATQNPFFGGGFRAIEDQPIWSALAQDFNLFPFFYTGSAMPGPVPRSAHSIYFQVLGDHGFVGLFIYIAILCGAYLQAGRVARRASKLNAPEWIVNLATMLRLVTFAFGLGGAALSLAYFDLIFAVIGLILVLDKTILPATVTAKTELHSGYLGRQAAYRGQG